MRRTRSFVAALFSASCASTPLPQEVTVPAIPAVVVIETHASASHRRPGKCDSPGTIEHVVTATYRYRSNTCPLFMPVFDEFIQLGCDKAVPELATAVGVLRDVMKTLDWYSVSTDHQKPSEEHASARLRVASLAWSMMPTRCQNHVPKPMSGDDTDASIAKVDPSWRDCYPDPELLLVFFDEPAAAGKVTLLAYVFAVAMEPYMTSVGKQFLRQTLWCNTITKTHEEDGEIAFRAYGW